jgi:hypothetical protein
VVAFYCLFQVKTASAKELKKRSADLFSQKKEASNSPFSAMKIYTQISGFPSRSLVAIKWSYLDGGDI